MNENGYDDEALVHEEAGMYFFTEYDITSSPNDFNVKTIFDFLTSEVMEIPNFQRNYVWDIGRASRLIESLIMGLPIPQIFLFEKGRNKFLVIDGQQRLMTIYYFIKGRFPRKDERVELGKIFDEHNHIPQEIFDNNRYFGDFKLQLPSGTFKGNTSPLHGKSYATLDGEHRDAFDLRTIRNVIIKQNAPSDDDSSIYEIFNRLNSGGVTLTPQEIRSSLYHSKFDSLIKKLNEDPTWRGIFGTNKCDVHLKDVEVILRGFAMLVEGYTNYSSPMNKFLNNFTRKRQSILAEETEYLEKLFHAFLARCKNLGDKAFSSKTGGGINKLLFEAVFVAICEDAYHNKNLLIVEVDSKKLEQLKVDDTFVSTLQFHTTDKDNVKKRIDRAKKILLGQNADHDCRQVV